MSPSYFVRDAEPARSKSPGEGRSVRYAAWFQPRDGLPSATGRERLRCSRRLRTAVAVQNCFVAIDGFVVPGAPVAVRLFHSPSYSEHAPSTKSSHAKSPRVRRVASFPVQHRGDFQNSCPYRMLDSAVCRPSTAKVFGLMMLSRKPLQHGASKKLGRFAVAEPPGRNSSQYSTTFSSGRTPPAVSSAPCPAQAAPVERVHVCDGLPQPHHMVLPALPGVVRAKYQPLRVIRREVARRADRRNCLPHVVGGRARSLSSRSNHHRRGL